MNAPVRITLEVIAGRECVVVASAADPKVCNVITPRDPEYAQLRARAEASR